jgi:MFS family permease
MSPARATVRRAQLATAALFCFLGFQYASWAAQLPAIATRLGLTPAEIGMLLLATGIGAAASFPLVATMMTRLGSRRTAAVSCLVLGLVLVALAFVPDYPLALLVMLVDGVAVACLNVAMNAQGTALEVRHGIGVMTKLHATFSGGTFAAALVSAAVTAATTSLAVHFGVATVILALLAGYAWPRLLTEDLPAETRVRKRLTLPSRATVWLALAMVFGTITEGAMNDWSPLYLRDVAHAPAELVPAGIATVSATMVLARLFADRWRARWGDRRVVLIGAAAAGAGLGGALAVGGLIPGLVGFACVGLGMAAVTPCVYVAATKDGTNALTLVAAMGTTGLLAGPPVIGFVTNATNLVMGMATVALSAILVTVSVAQVRWPAQAAATSDRDALVASHD